MKHISEMENILSGFFNWHKTRIHCLVQILQTLFCFCPVQRGNTINRLKNGCQIEHHRHRSPRNFLANLFGGLVAYQLLSNKPSLNLSSVKKLQFSL